jgi:hypothetical protein
MPTDLEAVAIEEGTYALTATFTDEDGSEVTPNVITWTLTDLKGNVINARQDVAVGSPASSVTIVLKGDDLSLDTDEVGLGQRVLTVEATYDSSLGSNLPLKDVAFFNVVDLKAVT